MQRKARASRVGLDLLSYDLRVENASFSFFNSHGATQAGAQSRGGSAGPSGSPLCSWDLPAEDTASFRATPQCWAVTAAFRSLFTADLGRVLPFIEQPANSRNWKNKTSLSVSLLVLKDSAAGSSNEERYYFQKPFSPKQQLYVTQFPRD